MKNKNKSLYSILMQVLGILLLGIGFSTPGLWPYQLLCCVIGVILIGLS